MKRLTTLSALSLSVLLAATPAFAKNDATDSIVKNYMRSSIYTILVNSESQNKRIDEETKNTANQDAIMSIAKSFANTDEKKAANDSSAVSLASLPMMEFVNIPIPNQFNDHNLSSRIIDFDALREGITPEEAKKFTPQSKNAKAGKFAKGLAGGLLGAAAGKEESSMLHVDEVDEYLPAVLNKYFTKENVAPSLLAKWYDYNETGNNHWDLNLITSRGNYNFTQDDLAKAANDQKIASKIANTAFQMINNTYVVAVNFRFRSYQAVVAEAAAMAKAAGSMFGSIGQLAAQGASTAASAAAGDGFTVQAVSYLYKLKWDDDHNQKFAVDMFEKNATLDDLIKSGLCELEFVGKEKASANVRQSLFSDKPMSQLVQRATARAIDASIAKLQEKNEVFRTAVPITECDGNGTFYAAIGTKEGLTKKDVYEILEAQEDADGKITYKAVGEVKPVEGKIWNNVYGAEEEAAENKANANGKSKDFDDSAVELGRTQFKGKKGDFNGYYIRLKKKG